MHTHMKKLSIAALAIVSMIMASCSSPKQEQQDHITGLEESLFSGEAGRINMNKANELILAYRSFAEDYPDDPLAPEYLFKAGDMAMNLNKPREAVQIFDRILNNYPDYEKIPQSLFLKGYIYENQLRDLTTAKKIYEEFLERFPEDEFADDAEMSIRNLGKSPEELIREFEERSGEAQEKETI